MQWDSAVSLAFAAEQLFAAAQLLTSDLVPWNEALRIAYHRHLVPLIENDDFLPEDIRDKMLEARRSYDDASARGLTRDFARELASELMGILAEITPMLRQLPGPSALGIDLAA